MTQTCACKRGGKVGRPTRKAPRAESAGSSAFKPEQRTIKVGDSPVYAKLAKAPATGPRGPRPGKPEEGPKGFKEIPY